MARMLGGRTSEAAGYHPGPPDAGAVERSPSRPPEEHAAGTPEPAPRLPTRTFDAGPKARWPLRWAAGNPARQEAEILAALFGSGAVTVLLALRYWTVAPFIDSRGPATTRPGWGEEWGVAAPVAMDGVQRRPDSAPAAGARAEPRGRSATSADLPPLPRIPDGVEVPVAPVTLDSAEPRRDDLVRPQEFTRLELGREGPDGDHAGASLAAVAAARREAERAVEAFAGALRARDTAALGRAVMDLPAAERAQWAKVFAGASAVEAQITVTDVHLDGDVIVASVRTRVDVRVHGVRTPTHSETVSIATLVRDSSGWRLRHLR